ncbi:MAG: sugar phosphate isomerase/epimerase family protein [Candidatus Nanopelagicales bacterium]
MPNLLGVHALVWASGWSESEVRTAVASTKNAGYDLIEIPALSPTDIDPIFTKKILDEYQVKSSCSLGLTFDADLNNEDENVVGRGEARLLQALDLVRKLEGEYLGGVIFSALGKYLNPPTAKARANVVAALKRLAKQAKKDGITLGLEVVNRYESNLLNTGRSALDLINEIGESNVVVHLDTYHMNIEEMNMFDPVIEVQEKLGYVHIGANHRCFLDQKGMIDFDDFFKALAQVNYQGVITFESFSSAIVSKDLSNTLCIWRNLWEDNQALAIGAREFIEEKLQAVGMR